jgi:hypothetical protein
MSGFVTGSLVYVDPRTGRSSLSLPVVFFVMGDGAPRCVLAGTYCATAQPFSRVRFEDTAGGQGLVVVSNL